MGETADGGYRGWGIPRMGEAAGGVGWARAAPVPTAAVCACVSPPHPNYPNSPPHPWSAALPCAPSAEAQWLHLRHRDPSVLNGSCCCAPLYQARWGSVDGVLQFVDKSAITGAGPALALQASARACGGGAKRGVCAHRLRIIRSSAGVMGLCVVTYLACVLGGVPGFGVMAKGGIVSYQVNALRLLRQSR
jgi:hypothetical protein